MTHIFVFISCLLVLIVLEGTSSAVNSNLRPRPQDIATFLQDSSKNYGNCEDHYRISQDNQRDTLLDACKIFESRFTQNPELIHTNITLINEEFSSKYGVPSSQLHNQTLKENAFQANKLQDYQILKTEQEWLFNNSKSLIKNESHEQSELYQQFAFWSIIQQVTVDFKKREELSWYCDCVQTKELELPKRMDTFYQSKRSLLQSDTKVMTISDLILENQMHQSNASLAWIDTWDQNVTVTLSNVHLNNYSTCISQTQDSSLNSNTFSLISLPKNFSASLKLIITNSTFQYLNLSCPNAAIVSLPETVIYTEIIIYNSTFQNISVKADAMFNFTDNAVFNFTIDQSNFLEINNRMLYLPSLTYSISYTNYLTIRNSTFIGLNYQGDYGSLLEFYYNNLYTELTSSTFKCVAKPTNQHLYEQRRYMEDSNCSGCILQTVMVFYGTSTVTSYNNSFANCYNSTGAAIFALSYVYFLDSNSKYENISAGMGGIMNSYYANIEFKQLYVNSTLAMQGALVSFPNYWGSTLVIEDANISYVETIQSGGILWAIQEDYDYGYYTHQAYFKGNIYMSHFFSQGSLCSFFGQNAAQSVYFQGFITAVNIQNNYTGAFMYYEPANQQLIFQNINIRSINCKVDGCLLWAGYAYNITIQNVTTYGYDSSYTLRMRLGNYINDILSFDSIGYENDRYYIHHMDPLQLPYIGAAFYLRDAQQINSYNNTFSNHYLNLNSSVFNILRAQSFYDENSVYKNNYGIFGGALFIAMTTNTVFNRTKFSGNIAIYGGSMFSMVCTNILFYNITVDSSTSYRMGGFMLNYGTSFVNLIYRGENRRMRRSLDSKDNEHNDTLEFLGIMIEKLSESQNYSKIQLRRYLDSRVGVIAFLNGAQLYGSWSLGTGGGLIYSLDDAMSIHLNGSVNATFIRAAGGSGGLINVQSGQNILIYNSTFLQSISYYGSNGGSLITTQYLSGTLFLSNNSFKGYALPAKKSITTYSTQFFTQIIQNNFSPPQFLDFQVQYVYIYMNGGTVYSENNIYENLYFSANSVAFFLTAKAIFSDQNSIYRNNQGYYAGGFELDTAGEFNLTNATFINCTSVTKGLISVQGVRANITLKSIRIFNYTSVSGLGGLIKFQTDPSTYYIKPFRPAIKLTDISISIFNSLGVGGFFYAEDYNFDLIVSNLSIKNLTANDGQIFYGVATNLDKGLGNVTIENFTLDCGQTNWTNRRQYPVQQQLFYSSGYNFNLKNITISNCLNMNNSCFAVIKNSQYISSQNMQFLQLSSQGSGIFQTQNVTLVDFKNFIIKNVESTTSGLFTIGSYATKVSIFNITSQNILVRAGGGGIMSTIDSRLSGDLFVTGVFNLTKFVIRDVSIIGQGGLFYIDNYFISNFTMQEIDSRNIKATKGGIFYINNMTNELVVSTAQSSDQVQQSGGNLYSEIQTENDGVFLYSLASNLSIKIYGLSVKCQDSFTSNISQLMINSQTTQSVIYIENNQKALKIYNSSFSNCQTSSRGGVVTLISSNLEDYGSSYTQNFAQQGGVFYFFNSSFYFQDSKFDQNIADEGGIMLVDRKTIGLISNANITNTYASSKGGILSIVFTSITDTSLSQITFKGNNTFITNTSSGLGGLFYCNSKYMSLQIQNMTIQQVSASSQGGILFVQEIDMITFTNVEFSNLQSPTGGFIYTQSNNVIFYMMNSRITCLDQTSQYDNVASFFYFENSKSVSFQQIKLRNCISNYQTAAIQVKNTNIKISDSQIYNIQGVNGGVIRMYSSNATITNTNFTNNSAKIGGVLFLSENSFAQVETAQFYQNTATMKAGVINIISDSYVSINRSSFIENKCGKDSSVIDVLGSATDQNISISNTLFKNNSAQKNAIRMIYAVADIQNCQFIDNSALEQSNNIILDYTNLTISNTTFSKQENASAVSNPQAAIYGSFISIVLSVFLDIRDSNFTNGQALKGGAIYLQGDSEIMIVNSNFLNNQASSVGGAIYGSDFAILTTKDCLFQNNFANTGAGDDIYATGDISELNIVSSSFQNPTGTQSIFAQKTYLSINQTIFNDYGQNSSISFGSALQCYDCSKITVLDSDFQNLRSQAGGAIYIKESDSTAAPAISQQSKYTILRSNFSNCSSQVGGALYLDNCEDILVAASQFSTCSASSKSIEGAILAQELGLNLNGAGGAIYFTCNSQNLDCSLKLKQNNSFSSNYAETQGGSIYWDMIEPTYQSGDITFQNNSAVLYGDDIACFGQQVIQISEETYNQQVSLSQQRLLSRRSISEITTINNSMTLDQVVSGGEFPVIYLAVIDKYAQIVGSDTSSKVLTYVNSTFNLNESAMLYPPVIEGTNSFLTDAGVIKLDNMVFDGSPGNQYQIIVQLNSLDSSKVSNQQFMLQNSFSSMNLKIIVNLRKCELGEQFTVGGKCLKCVDSYSLVQLNSVGSCTECPRDKATCPGGSLLWPNSGFWRSSNTSANIYQCHNENACLGIYNASQSLDDQCLVGYQGILCTDCQENFSRSGSFQCSLCPEQVRNTFRLAFIAIGVLLLLVALVATSLSGAPDKNNLLSIYVKIMLNHFQLLMMVSVFNINWSKEITSFFISSDDISTVSTQIFSVDCFITSGDSQQQTFRIQNVKLVLIAALPIAIIVGCIAGCYLIKYAYREIKKQKFMVQNYVVSSIIVSLFLAHPSIVQFMFQDFRCETVDGVDRLQKDMEIICWGETHNLFGFGLALPSIAIWGLGIPLFGLILIIRRRKDLDSVLVRKQYGFLYRGYKKQFFFWDILIMYRKIIIIACAVFFKNLGVIVQTLVVLVVVFIFLGLNTLIKPFKDKNLSHLESISLLAALITFYIAIFFILNKSESWIAENYEYKDSSVYLSTETQLFFFALIILTNCCFFLFWLKCVYSQLQIKFREKLPKAYILICLLQDNKKYDKELQKHERQMQNLDNKEQFDLILQSVQNLQESGKIFLSSHFLQSFKTHLGETTLKQMLEKNSNQSYESSNHPVIEAKTKKKKISRKDKKNILNLKVKDQSMLLEDSAKYSVSQSHKKKSKIKLEQILNAKLDKNQKSSNFINQVSYESFKKPTKKASKAINSQSLGPERPKLKVKEKKIRGKNIKALTSTTVTANLNNNVPIKVNDVPEQIKNVNWVESEVIILQKEKTVNLTEAE